MESERFYAYTELRRWEQLPGRLAEALRLDTTAPRHRCATAVAEHLGFDATEFEPVTLVVFWRIASGLVRSVGDAVFPEQRCEELVHTAVQWLELAEAYVVARDLRLESRRLPAVQIADVTTAIAGTVGREIGERLGHVVRIWERRGIFRRVR